MEIEINNLTAGYGDVPIIFGVSARIREGTMYAVIGPNGAGKSTLIKALFGQCRIFSGSISIDGVPVRAIDPEFLVKSGVAYVPQLANVFPSLSVRENLEIGTYVRRGYPLENVFDLFPDLRTVLDKRAGKLSGGQRNMLAVARALMSDPKVLLLDEAAAGLSPRLAEALWERLSQLVGSGMAVGVVEQNVANALKYADYVYLMTSGRVRSEASAAEMAARPDLDALFLEAAPATAEQ